MSLISFLKQNNNELNNCLCETTIFLNRDILESYGFGLEKAHPVRYSDALSLQNVR